MRKFAFLIATFAAQPAFAFDPCLVGAWNVDTTDLAHVLGAQMNGAATYTSGEVVMDVDTEGGIMMSVSALVINIEIPDIPAMDVSIDGFSAGSMHADEGAWTLTGTDYSLVGSADVMGQTMTIPFDASSGMFGGGLGVYGCSDDTLSFESTGDTARMPRRWTRLTPDS